MRRRNFMKGVAAFAAWPLAVRAQQAASPRNIGVLLVAFSPDSKEVRQFRLGLRDVGYSEGRDVVIEWRLANGDYDRVPELVADLVRSKIDVMVMDSTIATEVAKRATSTIPIVMALVLDPVGSGLVDSLAHPGGNVTGLSMMAMEIYPRRLQLLKELIPHLTRAGVFWESRPSDPRQGGQRTRHDCAVAFNRTEFRGSSKARAVRTSLLRYHRSKHPSTIRDRRPYLLCSSNQTSQTGIAGQAADHSRPRALA